MHRGGIGAARVERGLLQRAAANQLPHELTGMEVNMRQGGVWGVLWRVMERSCTEIEGGNVSYTPDMP